MELDEEKAKRTLALIAWSVVNKPAVPRIVEKIKGDPVNDSHQYSGFVSGTTLRITDAENKLISLTLPREKRVQTLFISYDVFRQRLRLEMDAEGNITTARDEENVKTYLVEIEDNEVEIDRTDRYRMTT
jgi:hypothetical protein